MRLLIVGQHYWPETFRITEVVSSLRRAGCSVSVLTGQPNYPDGVTFPGYSASSLRTEEHDGITVHRVPLVPRGNGSALRLVVNYLSFLASACLFGPWLLRGKRFDAVLVYAAGPILQSIAALWIGWIKGARVVTWIQDLWPESLEATGFVRNPRLLALVAWIVRQIYKRNDLLLVQSQAFRQPVEALAGAVEVRYHPNPGERASARTSGNAEDGLRLAAGFNVVFAGNLGTVQALETVVAAAEKTRQNSDLWWVIVGSGSRGDWLASEVARRGLKQVVLPGRFPAEAMPAILAQSSALLVSLIRNPAMSQTVPSKVQAYLAAGRPIVAALDGEGARVVSESGAGIACPAEDAAALCEAVLRLKALPEAERARMGDAGRRYYQQHFDPDMLALSLIEHLRPSAASSSPAARVE
ncbi:MAG: glycosyltransferase family 4 protein [Burkholderiales bacterium]|nr:glycosyltransferase family 4 protein [Burkholderiales bacterium]